MKKYYIILIVVFMIIMFSDSNTTVSAYSGNYTEYKELNLAQGSLIMNWSEAEIEGYSKKLGKRKFSGWNTYTVNKNVPCTFIVRTLDQSYNNSYSGIDYDYSVDTTDTVKTNINYTGTLKVKTTGKIKKFNVGLDSSSKIETSYDTIKTVKKSERISLTVDPKTQYTLMVKGEGNLTNGYAKEYFCYTTISKGAFEYFVITDIYTYAEKKFIW